MPSHHLVFPVAMDTCIVNVYRLLPEMPTDGRVVGERQEGFSKLSAPFDCVFAQVTESLCKAQISDNLCGCNCCFRKSRSS